MRAALIALVVMTLPTTTHAAGRCPYGGTIKVPVTDFGGLRDPHVARSRSQRLLASLAHCHLFRPDHRGGIVPEVAADGGAFRGRTLTVKLVAGATFHDGAPITATDVMKSLQRVGRMSGAPLAVAARSLTFSAPEPTVLRVSAGPGVEVAELRALLARPEMAILRGGRPGAGRGCGAFTVAASTATTRRLDAFAGHAEGRPWIDRVVAKRIEARSREETAFVFADVDVAFTDVPRARRVGQAVSGGFLSYLALFHPRLRGAEGADLRKAVVALAAQARLSRHVDGRAEPARGPWPARLSPATVKTKPPSSLPRLGALVIAYREGDAELADLARALRDVLRPIASGSARVVAIDDLTLGEARAAAAPSWDIALVRHDWAALTKAQAALEAASMLQRGDLEGDTVLSRGTRRWANALTSSAGLVAVLHAERPVLYRKALNLRHYQGKLGRVRGGLPAIAEACGPR